MKRPKRITLKRIQRPTYPLHEVVDAFRNAFYSWQLESLFNAARFELDLYKQKEQAAILATYFICREVCKVKEQMLSASKFENGGIFAKGTETNGTMTMSFDIRQLGENL
jgi:hypothetical protein